MFYHPEEAHVYKLKHLKRLANAVLKGQYSTRIVTTYNAKDFSFLKK